MTRPPSRRSRSATSAASSAWTTSRVTSRRRARSRNGVLSTTSMVAISRTFDHHEDPAVVQVQPVDQPQDERDEVVGHLLLGHRARAQPDDRQDREQSEAQRDVHPHPAQQRHRHEDADVERDVGQQQVRAPMAAEVEHECEQEDRQQVDAQVDHVVGVHREHVDDGRHGDGAGHPTSVPPGVGVRAGGHRGCPGRRLSRLPLSGDGGISRAARGRAPSPRPGYGCPRRACRKHG